MLINDYCNEVRAGDKAAFAYVYQEFSGKLFSFIYAKIKSQECANDIVQETFVKLWKHHSRLNPQLKLSTQIFQIAKTTLLDELRNKERKYKLCKVAKKLYERDFAESADGFDLLNLKELKKRFQKALMQLPPVRKKVFELSREEKLSYKEIAQRLSISERTVDKHIELALKQMRTYFPLVALFVGLFF